MCLQAAGKLAAGSVIVDTGANIGIENSTHRYAHYTERGDLPKINGVSGQTSSTGDGMIGDVVVFDRGHLGIITYGRRTPACRVSTRAACLLADIGLAITTKQEAGESVMYITTEVNGQTWRARATTIAGLYCLPTPAAETPAMRTRVFGDYGATDPRTMRGELRKQGERVYRTQVMTATRVDRTSGAFRRHMLTLGLPNTEAVARQFRRLGGIPGGRDGRLSPFTTYDRQAITETMAAARRQRSSRRNKRNGFAAASAVPEDVFIIVDGLGSHMNRDLAGNRYATTVTEAYRQELFFHPSARMTSQDAVIAVSEGVRALNIPFDTRNPNVAQRNNGQIITICSDNHPTYTSAYTVAHWKSMGCQLRFCDRYASTGWYTELAEKNNWIGQQLARVNLYLAREAMEEMGLAPDGVWSWALEYGTRQWWATPHPHPRYRKDGGDDWWSPLESVLGRRMTWIEIHRALPGIFASRCEMTEPVTTADHTKQWQSRARFGRFFGVDASSRIIFVETTTLKIVLSTDCVIRWADNDETTRYNFTAREHESDLDDIDWLARRRMRMTGITDYNTPDPLLDHKHGVTFAALPQKTIAMTLEAAIEHAEAEAPSIFYAGAATHGMDLHAPVHAAMAPGRWTAGDPGVTMAELQKLIANDTHETIARLANSIRPAQAVAHTTHAAPDYTEACVDIVSADGERYGLMARPDGTHQIIDVGRLERMLVLRAESNGDDVYVETADYQTLKWKREQGHEPPLSIRKALDHPTLGQYWRRAAKTEADAFVEGVHYQKVRRSAVPRGKRVYRLVTVLSFKWAADGTLERFKCRNCIAQIKKNEKDLPDSYASVPSHKAVRLAQQCAVQFKASVYTDDVKCCFLFAPLDEEQRVYVEMPPHLLERDPDTGEEFVWKTLRAIYGQIVASRAWQTRYTRFAMHESGLPLRRMSRESSVYVLDWQKMRDFPTEWGHISKMFSGGGFYCTCQHVDDGFTVTTDPAAYAIYRERYSAVFTITGGTVDHARESEPCQHLRTLIQNHRQGHVTWTQRQFCEGIARKLGMPTDKTSRTPIAKERAGLINKERLADTPDKQAQALLECGGRIGGIDIDTYDQALTLYRSITMSASWLAITTHPQLLSPTHILASMHLPDGNALASLPAYVRYILHEKDEGLHYKFKGLNLLRVEGYSDASLGNRPGTGDSQFGFDVGIEGCCATEFKVGWTLYAYTSTFETELHSLSEMTRSIVYTRDFLLELGGPDGIHQSGPSVGKCDNMSAVRHGTDRISSSKARSIRLRDFYCTQMREAGAVRFEWVAGNDNRADMYTKQLPADTLEKHSRAARDA